jgi:hypothetical protein
MHYRLFFIMLVLSFLVSACNLGSAESATPELIVTQAPSTTQPQISIVSPRTGDQFAVNEQILLTVYASDSVGVTRVQLFADGIIVKTISSESITGDQEFDGVLDFTPRVEGEYALRVLAFRGAIASEPQEIVISVGQDQILVTQRPDVVTGPVIPDDGLCRVLINVNLNFRNEPTTERDNVITILSGGTLALVIARLNDFSWWKITVNNRIGWVSGGQQFTTPYGNCQSIPIENVVVNTPTYTPTVTHTPRPTITLTPTIAPPPDLLVPTFVGEKNLLIPTGASGVTSEYSFTVKNQGQRPSGQFSVEVRIEGELAYSSVIASIDPNSIITHTFDLSFTQAGVFDIRVDVDTDHQVEEQIEVNNRGDITVTVTNQ